MTKEELSMIDENELKQSFVLEKALYYLSSLPDLRKDNTPDINLKLDEIDLFLRKCLKLSEYYDYLNTNLELDLRLFNDFSNNKILKELLNRSHSEGDIFLYIDSNILEKGDSKDIRITIYRKLLSRLVQKFLDPNPNISNTIMSKSYREYIFNKVKLAILKDYESLSITEIPPYRIWDKKNRKMIYFKPVPINQEINKLKGNISKFRENKQQIIDKYKNIILNYYQNWWSLYKKTIDQKYSDISEHFWYYNGIHIKIAISESFVKTPSFLRQTELALCEGKKRNNGEGFNIKIDDKIHTILFLDDYFGEDYDLIVELGLDLKSFKEDSRGRLNSSIDQELQEEIFDLFKLNYDDTIFEIFSDKMLSIMGIHLTTLEDELGIQYTPDCKANVFKIIRFRKKDTVNFENIERYRKKDEKVIILSSAIIPDIIKKRYEKDENIYLIDIYSFYQLIFKNPIGFNVVNTNAIIKDIMYPFLKEKLKNKEVNTRLYQANKLLYKLKNCPEGIEGWKKFEDICIEIINFVFKDSFRNYKIKIQSRTYDNLDIRDAIVQNTGERLWKELRLDYDAKNIIFEFKNSAKEIGKEELIQVSDYLEKESLGRIGIIFSRKGLSKSGVEKQRSLLRDAKKLILVLNENDLKDLINKKIQKEEPEQLLEIFKFDIEISI